MDGQKDAFVKVKEWLLGKFQRDEVEHHKETFLITIDYQMGHIRHVWLSDVGKNWTEHFSSDN